MLKLIVLLRLMKVYLSEMAGTYILVLVGAGAIALGLPHFWISVAFGAVVTCMILVFGKTSGAHINPAVSIGFYFIQRDKKLLYYIPFQLVGALLASATIWIALPKNETYGETLPEGGLMQAFGIEVFITFLLMLSILVVIRYNNLWIVAFVVGFVVFLAAYFAGPYTGASMNPARSFGPAIVAGKVKTLWLYFLAPTLGALGAIFFPLSTLSEDG